MSPPPTDTLEAETETGAAAQGEVADLQGLEERVADNLAGAEGVLDDDEEDIDLEDWEQEPPLPPLRVGVVLGCWILASAITIGSIFEGLPGKIHPAIAGLCGIGVAAQASRRKSALVANLTIILGITAVGIVLVLPEGLDNITKLSTILKEAAAARSVLRPPAEFLPGFQLIVGWLMACVGFAAGWVGIEMRKPVIGMIVPLPLIAMGAISVPDNSKLGAGLAALVLMILGLALLSSLNNLTASEGNPAPSLAYEARRAAKALPLIGFLVAAMFALAKTGFLFPAPYIDPVRDAQRPKAVPLSQVEDKVLFQVRSKISGPWRIGLLDIYQENEWRLPPFAESDLQPVPESGIVDSTLEAGRQADFLIKGLGGSVLPGLPNTTGVVAKGSYAYDPRTGNIRLTEGQIRDNLSYTVQSADLPTEEALKALNFQLPKNVKRFAEIPDPPPQIQGLLDEAPKEPVWDRLEFLRKRLLETVTAAGPGTPVAVPPSKVEDMIFGKKEASPFEIVAAQAMLARWAGVPARIAYGYDGGELVGEGIREVRPKHGASWLEVYFPGFKWLPLIGSPLKAKTNLTPEGPTNADPNVQPSEDIAVQVYIPLRIEEKGFIYDQIRRIVLLLIPIALVALIVYLVYPSIAKSIRKSRRRGWAESHGPIARIEVAYAEFRDTCSDFGYGSSHATPLGFYDKFVEDEEHREFAWLVTRILYGDLREEVDLDDATAAQELSRSLRVRLKQAQPLTLRTIALMSRLSLKNPYAPDVRALTRKEKRDAEIAA